jgi:hypothetical protein
MAPNKASARRLLSGERRGAGDLVVVAGVAGGVNEGW